MTAPRILFTDIETIPAKVLRFEDAARPATTPIEFIIEPPRMVCFAAKFYGEKTLFRGENMMSHEDMVISAWEMLNEADIVVTFFGNGFDLPWFNTEFKLLGLPKPSPYRSLDIHQICRQFKLPSKKLAYISKRFGWGKGKFDSGGIRTWLAVMAGDKKVWQAFRKYNMQDVDVLVDAFEDLRSWFPAWFNLNVYADGYEENCNKCGSDDLIRQGFAHTATGKYQRFACRRCGSWMRSKSAWSTTGLR